MRFAPEPNPPPPRPSPEPRHAIALLLGSAALTAAATTGPWLCVQFEQLWGRGDGPPGWQTDAGFTCLCASALVAVMALAETNTHRTRDAVRPASLLLTTLALLVLAFEWRGGPGWLRGVTAAFTVWFYAAAIGQGTLTSICAWRWLRSRATAGGSAAPPPDARPG